MWIKWMFFYIETLCEIVSLLQQGQKLYPVPNQCPNTKMLCMYVLFVWVMPKVLVLVTCDKYTCVDYVYRIGAPIQFHMVSMWVCKGHFGSGHRFSSMATIFAPMTFIFFVTGHHLWRPNALRICNRILCLYHQPACAHITMFAQVKVDINTCFMKAMRLRKSS